MSKFKFTKQDLKFIAVKGISVGTIEAQIENFRRGFQPVSLVSPATSGNGIICLIPEETDKYAKHYEKRLQELKALKFVPSSGAASRMFKDLFEYINEQDPGHSDSGIYTAVLDFIEGLDKLALTADLEKILKRGEKNLDTLLAAGEYREIVEAVLTEGGLNYGHLPKALIGFHRYDKENRTAIEEHLVEGASYCKGKDGRVMIHFTVSDEHLDAFIDLLDRKQATYEKRFGVSYQIELSIQRSYTDTIAVDLNNDPFRSEDGNLLFRPGGHGALLTNLNELDADIVFIKNIDNIAPDRLKPATFLYKEALAGILLDYQERIFAFLQAFERGDINESLVKDSETFLEQNLSILPPEGYSERNFNEKTDYIRNKLNRPLRICGMVKNKGEPGGGPYWTMNPDGSVSLQIVESSQIDFQNRDQAGIVKSATHFNPVDLVCAIKDQTGSVFDLKKHIDPSTGFISVKSQDGRSLKAQELPGLWNGAMADWNTVFVEVPVETFNPVKTINDLLRPQHIA